MPISALSTKIKIRLTHSIATFNSRYFWIRKEQAMPRDIRIKEKNLIEDVLKRNAHTKRIIKNKSNDEQINEQVEEKAERPIFPTLRSVKLDQLEIIKDHYRQVIDDGAKIVSKINNASDEKNIAFYENQLEMIYEKIDVLDHQERNELCRIKEQIFDNLNNIRHYHKQLESYLKGVENCN